MKIQVFHRKSVFSNLQWYVGSVGTGAGPAAPSSYPLAPVSPIRRAFVPLVWLLLAGPASAQAAGGVGGVWAVETALDGAAAGDRTGAAVACVADIDGDGMDDFVIGIPFADPNGRNNAGRVVVRSGATGAVLLTIDGAKANNKLGSAVAGVGDLDNDGVPDLLIGAPETDVGGLIDAGSAAVLSGATGGLIFRFDGGAANDRFGNAVADAGDVDGDGLDDLLVGAWWADPGGISLAGSAYVFSGATGSLIHRFDGSALGDALGGSVAGIGDLDGDGFDDVAVGAHNASPGGLAGAGSIFVFSGATGSLLRRFDGTTAGDWLGTSVAAAGDIDGDGVPDVLGGAENASPGGIYKGGSAYVWSGASGQVLYQFDGDLANSFLGSAVAGVGDADLDGVPDVAVGADGYPFAAQADAGLVRVFSGADGSLLHESGGALAGDRYGTAVCGGRDLDGDGLPEIVIGADQADPGGLTDAGRVEVLGFFPGLFSSQATVSAAAGANVVFSIDLPASEAGFSYALLASRSGAGPTPLGGIDVPLTSDPLLSRMAAGNAPAVFRNAYGVLNFAGDGVAYLDLPPGYATPYIGTTAWFAVISYQPPATGRLSSVAVTLDVLP
ncbi:MAG: hypothetical protein D6702_10610 [Planctomycetota bacterium]|nr:MAG: hypothetical protein D6702_10610 [Planctomycetota bacterium]